MITMKQKQDIISMYSREGVHSRHFYACGPSRRALARRKPLNERAASAAATKEVSDANDGVARGDKVGAAMPLKGVGQRPGVEKQENRTAIHSCIRMKQ